MKEILLTLRYGVATMLAQTSGSPSLKTPERTFWGLALVLALSYAALGYLYLPDNRDYYFNVYMLPYFALIVLAVLVAGFLPRIFDVRPNDNPYVLPAIILSLQIPVMLTEGLLWVGLEYAWPGLDIDNDLWRNTVIVLEGLLLFRAFLLHYGPTTAKLQLRLIATACLGIAALYYVPYEMETPYFITASYDPSERVYLNAEETLTPQPALVQKALDEVASSRPGVVDYYGVILAGDSSQDVFKKEAIKAQGLFDTYLGTHQRSVVLINNTATVKTIPLATISNLRAVFAGLKTKLQPEEDVIILYLTSHGGQDTTFQTYLPGVGLQTIDAKKIAALLKEFGFTWRVAIVSSCYSGSYIPEFDTPTTLIITAASATTTSFGCSATADLTWFGKALLTEALPKSQSFEDLYTLTTREIASREVKEGIPPSLPQYKSGQQISDYLSKHSPFLKIR